MKKLSFLALAAVATMSAAPLAGQSLTTKGYDFIDAVQKSDSNKAIQVLTDNPPGIVNSKNDQGDTGLIIALARGDADWTAFLLKKGADVNLAGHGGDTPLITAARVGFEEAAEWLISLGAKVDATNKMGETPLIIAVQQRQPRVVKLLLDQGADPDRTDAAAGYSARDYAARDNRGRQILQMIEAKKPKAAN